MSLNARNYVFAGHAKQEEYALDALYRQEPLTNGHPQTTGWFKEESTEDEDSEEQEVMNMAAGLDAMDL